jgi:hypothetical protein
MFGLTIWRLTISPSVLLSNVVITLNDCRIGSTSLVNLTETPVKLPEKKKNRKLSSTTKGELDVQGLLAVNVPFGEIAVLPVITKES